MICHDGCHNIQWSKYLPVQVANSASTSTCRCFCKGLGTERCPGIDSRQRWTALFSILLTLKIDPLEDHVPLDSVVSGLHLYMQEGKLFTSNLRMSIVLHSTAEGADNLDVQPF